jgi:TonB-dependent starch-binding outer membrane protein SusC
MKEFTVVVLFLFSLISASLAQKVEISGKVTSADENMEIPGANVLIKGTQQGTITDLDGNYSIQVNKGETLIYTSVGYKDKEVVIKDQTTIDIVLKLEISDIDEVVVIGYGTQKKSDLTGSIAKVESEDLQKLPATNMDQALQGRASGVWITQSSEPAGMARVHIRGLGTTNVNQPLYVIDGIPLATPDKSTGYMLNDINPADIESIEVLKDASATAIYGARAANGVILITTKKGKAGKVNINFESYTGIQRISKKINVLDKAGYKEYIDNLYGNVDRQAPDNFTSNPNLANTDWQEEFYRQGKIQNYYMSVSGGTKNALFNISGGYLHHEGIKVGNYFKRLNLRVNSEINKGRFKFGENINISRTIGRFPGGPALSESNPTSVPPVMPLKCDSCIGGWGNPTPSVTGESEIPNPVAMATYHDLFSEGYRILGNIYGEFEIIDGLKYKLTLGGDYSNSYGGAYKPRIDMGISKYTWLDEPTLTRNSGNSRQWIVEHLLTYNKTLWQDHNINIILGHTAEERYGADLGIYVQGFGVDNIHPVSEADTVISKYGGEGFNHALLSYFGRVNYAFMDKYLLTASVRRDGTSRFDKDFRYGVFPSVSIGWKISQEGFMESVPYISFLKFRASWGQTGNQDIGSNFAYLSTLGWATRYPFGVNQEVSEAYASWNLANKAMQWETSEQTDIGLEIGALDDKLFLVADYYIKKTKNMLLEVPFPYYSGIWREFPYLNTGEVLNNGLEFELSYKEKRYAFKYDISLNFTTIHNEVLSLGKRTQPIFNKSGTTKTTEGGQIGEFFGWKTEGIFQNDLHVETYNAMAPEGQYYQQFATQPGDIIFSDIGTGNPDGTVSYIPDGRVTDADRVTLGSPIPDFLFGFNANFEYKGFDFSAFVQGVYGNEVLNLHKQSLYDTHNYRNKHSDVLNAWSGEGTSDEIPRIGIGDANQNNRISDRYIEDGSFIRLKNVQLGYTFPKRILSKIGQINTFRLYLSATNILTLTKYTGYDPEVGMGGWYSVDNKPALNKGIDGGSGPMAYTLQAGLQLSF